MCVIIDQGSGRKIGNERSRRRRNRKECRRRVEVIRGVVAAKEMSLRSNGGRVEKKMPIGRK